MTAYHRGAAREREVVKTLREEGEVAYRSAGSHGAADVLVNPAKLIQVKSGLTAYGHFGPRDRAALLEEAAVTGGQALLYWFSPKGLRIIPSSEWPS